MFHFSVNNSIFSLYFNWLHDDLSCELIVVLSGDKFCITLPDKLIPWLFLYLYVLYKGVIHVSS